MPKVIKMSVFYSNSSFFQVKGFVCSALINIFKNRFNPENLLLMEPGSLYKNLHLPLPRPYNFIPE